VTCHCSGSASRATLDADDGLQLDFFEVIALHFPRAQPLPLSFGGTVLTVVEYNLDV